MGIRAWPTNAPHTNRSEGTSGDATPTLSDGLFGRVACADFRRAHPSGSVCHTSTGRRLAIVEVPQTVLANWVQAGDANEAKIAGTAAFGNLDGGQMASLEENAAI
ncbi:hypothetical protein Rcae01_05074 [Novipirellula caenicola]|uniref:Transposase n=1 Tax=Novipirellula caenicola TaxID=1536901 RepID=A0ABP9VWQ2_9BACT